jgi:cystathionine beta-synthase
MVAPVFESVVDAIGDTPLFRLRGLGRELAVPVYAKAEFLSVGGSVKDRAALAMVEAAERDGQLGPGAPSWRRRRATPASAWPSSDGSAATG